MPQTRTKRAGSTRSKTTTRRSGSSSSSSARSRSNGRRSASRGGANSGRTATQSRGVVGEVLSKAKLPAVAVGGAIAGLAGGVALTRNGQRRKVLGVPLPGTGGDTAKALGSAAKEIGKAGQRFGQLASEVRQVREEVSKH